MKCIKCGANVTVGATKCYNCSHLFNKIETEVVTIPKHQITALTCENTILTAKVAELEKKLAVSNEALIFVEHIEAHLVELGLQNVMCKICGKTIDEIYKV
jgi:hypothetical protein